MYNQIPEKIFADIRIYLSTNHLRHDQKQNYCLNETKSHWGLNPPPRMRQIKY